MTSCVGDFCSVDALNKGQTWSRRLVWLVALIEVNPQSDFKLIQIESVYHSALIGNRLILKILKKDKNNISFFTTLVEWLSNSNIK